MIRFLMLASLCAGAQTIDQIQLPEHVPPGKTVVLGFLGGIENWNDPNRSVRKVALRLREHGVVAETFANRRLGTAKKAVMRALDSNGNGKIEPEEAQGARVILYGQSLGGASALRMARFLEGKRVPVLLTVQVDSVGFRDGQVPANVRMAANFYQRQPMTVWGRGQIAAADPTKTRILGNFEYEYPVWHVHTWPESWPRRIFGGGHARMEADPVLWARIEGLILSTALVPKSD